VGIVVPLADRHLAAHIGMLQRQLDQVVRVLDRGALAEDVGAVRGGTQTLRRLGTVIKRPSGNHKFSLCRTVTNYA